MIIEFTGPTGAGKTMLSRQVIRVLRHQGLHIVASHPDLAPRNNESLQNLLFDLMIIPMLPRIFRRDRPFLKFAVAAIRRHADSRLTTLNLVRSVLRKIAIYEWHRRHVATSDVAILDEGSIHTAHQIFVHLDSKPHEWELDVFWKLVPKPDIVVHVKADKETLRDRALRRSNPPKRQGLDNCLGLFVEKAADMFDGLFDRPNVNLRLLEVETKVGGCVGLSPDAEKIASQIIEEHAHA